MCPPASWETSAMSVRDVSWLVAVKMAHLACGASGLQSCQYQTYLRRAVAGYPCEAAKTPLKQRKQQEGGKRRKNESKETKTMPTKQLKRARTLVAGTTMASQERGVASSRGVLFHGCQATRARFEAMTARMGWTTGRCAPRRDLGGWSRVRI